MTGSLTRLLDLFNRERRAERALVLATVVRTEGPTYSKAGAMLVIAASGEYAGLLSGGCLEGDLVEHSSAVLNARRAKIVRYDTRSDDDLLFGMGSGCEGAMDILLQPLELLHDWQPLTRLASSWQVSRGEALAVIVRSGCPALPAGCGVFLGDLTPFGMPEAPPPGSGDDLHSEARMEWAHFMEYAESLPRLDRSRLFPEALPGTDVLLIVQPAPPRILVLGAGPDAPPVVELAAYMGWSVVVVDHRDHYAQSSRFPNAESVLKGGPSELAERISRARTEPADTARFSAAIVMSHHLLTDRGYLCALADSDIPYIGLLGPVARRDRLVREMGVAAGRLRARLHAPMGLDLGARTPEAIALATIAEIHAVLARAHAASFGGAAHDAEAGVGSPFMPSKAPCRTRNQESSFGQGSSVRDESSFRP